VETGYAAQNAQVSKQSRFTDDDRAGSHVSGPLSGEVASHCNRWSQIGSMLHHRSLPINTESSMRRSSVIANDSQSAGQVA
jgi:hypothetical protein